jgi:type III pantothenate kinase
VNPNLPPNWLAIMIGNSRLHWAWFQAEPLQQAGDITHAEQLEQSEQSEQSEQPKGDEVMSLHPLLPQNWREFPIYVASVAGRTEPWLTLPQARQITLANVPIAGLYEGLGIDRAIALYGALQTYNCPVLVIDAGTALTFTASNQAQAFLGGAILPGISLQLRSLHEHTTDLPLLSRPDQLPPRWSLTTTDAINSGVLYGVTTAVQDGIRAWQREVNGKVVLTGGDGQLVMDLLRAIAPDLTLDYDPHLLFLGMRAIVRELSK